MKYFELRSPCGCCTVTAAFETDETCKAAFEKAGLKQWATIVDDDGATHEVDTFLGATDVTTEVKRAMRRSRKQSGRKKGKS